MIFELCYIEAIIKYSQSQTSFCLRTHIYNAKVLLLGNHVSFDNTVLG